MPENPAVAASLCLSTNLVFSGTSNDHRPVSAGNIGQYYTIYSHCTVLQYWPANAYLTPGPGQAGPGVKSFKRIGREYWPV